MKQLLSIVITLFIGINIHAQQKEISGTVTSKEDGLPLPGVSVIVKNSSTGVQTDFDGNYKITTKVGDVLVYSFIGLVTEERIVGKDSIINVAMKEDSAALDEVVISGYIGSTRPSKRQWTPTAAQIKRQQQRQTQSRISQQLQGQASGVNITTGQVGPASKVIIRGTSYDHHKQPLIIVDGVPIQKHNNHVIENIDKSQIDHVNVYKGAKAKRMFGASAKYGCIVISTVNGNYRIQNDESYAEITENDFETTKLSPLSTFSIDVDKAAYSNIRRMMNNGQSIPIDAVKIEEMINYFSYDYEQPTDQHPFAIHTEVAKTPWNEQSKLVRIGLQGKTYDSSEIPASNLTFLIDVSGSMYDTNKLPLLKSAFKLLVNQLRPKDKVSIVVYAGAAGMVLKPTSGDNKEKIIEAIESLSAGGSTAGGAGIELAYELAQKNFIKNGNNRVILATDGDFNVGASSDKAMKTLIEEKRETGVFLSVLGFGYGNYKDSKLETLADKGNGNHAYIDTLQEAKKVFGTEFGGTLFTIAKDVKIQIEFNPSKVQAYRLIGYENRLLADEDFVDDTKDAGELGSGHTVTALYEIIPVGVESDFVKNVDDLKYTTTALKTELSDELFTVKFRYKQPEATTSVEMVHIQKDEVTEASVDLKFASAVALLGMQLRHSKYDNNATLANIIQLAKEGRGKDNDGYRAEFIRMVESYSAM